MTCIHGSRSRSLCPWCEEDDPEDTLEARLELRRLNARQAKRQTYAIRAANGLCTLCGAADGAHKHWCRLRAHSTDALSESARKEER